jgi:hypothetical protein
MTQMSRIHRWRTVLDGLSYPARRWQILGHASERADVYTLCELKTLPDGLYRSDEEVMSADPAYRASTRSTLPSAAPFGRQFGLRTQTGTPMR